MKTKWIEFSQSAGAVVKSALHEVLSQREEAMRVLLSEFPDSAQDAEVREAEAWLNTLRLTAEAVDNGLAIGVLVLSE